MVHQSIIELCSGYEFLIDRNEGSEPTAEWQISNGRLRRSPGGRPADIVKRFGTLNTLHESHESELKCEEQRNQVGTNRNAQQAPAGLTATMSPSE
jgi:hypothetical protein